MKIELIKINKLKPAKYNPRQISTKQYKDLKESIEKFGLVDPIIVNEYFVENYYVVIGGHQRLKICKELGYKDIDCIVLNLNKEEERELNIRLNKNTGDFDMDILANEFDIEELTDWGFKHIDLDINIDKITEGNTEDDHIPEVKESRVKLGDVWQLGNHRLMCGDSTKESDVEKLMNGDKADMVFTDPPYGVDYNGQGVDGVARSGKFGKIKNDTDAKVAKQAINIVSHWQITKIWWGANCFPLAFNNRCAFVVWDKEIVGDRFSPVEMAFIENEKRIGFFKHQWHGMIKASERGQKRIHPTQKPVALAEYCFKTYGEPKKVVDLFLGSGSTLIACEKTNRVCYGMELDTKYCDVIIERWEQFTGQKAKKV